MRKLVAATLCALLTIPVAAQADLFAKKSGKDVFRSQARVLDARARQQGKTAIRIDGPSVITPTRWGTPGRGDIRYKGEYLAMARQVAMRHGVPADLFLRLVQQESGWNAGAVSPKGAIGLAQLMPETAARLGVDPYDPRQNLEGGARYLAQQYRQFGSWRLALAAYNAGPEAVQRYGGVPPYRETRNYVKAIWGG